MALILKHAKANETESRKCWFFIAATTKAMSLTKMEMLRF